MYLALASTVLMGWPVTTEAEEPSIEALRRKLEQRDRIILELIERIEALEQGVGISPSSSTDAVTRQDRESGEAVSGLETQPPDPSEGVPQSTEVVPGRVAVSREAAERALERSLTQVGALLLPRGALELQPGITYQRNEDATPTCVSPDGNTFAGQRERNLDSLTGDFTVRLGLPGDTQLELGLPYRSRDIETVTNVGFAPVESRTLHASDPGDPGIGVATTLLRESAWRPDLIGRVTWDTRTGDTNQDEVPLESGFDEVRASLTAANRQDPIVFLGSL